MGYAGCGESDSCCIIDASSQELDPTICYVYRSLEILITSLAAYLGPFCDLHLVSPIAP
jgi:hypothetical protein